MRFDLAAFFDRQREIIEAAETPFAKFAIFVLPILAPTVPASLTGLHLYKLFFEIFTFAGADRLAFVLSSVVALVLEMLGYVGAISFIQSVFRLVKTKNALYVLPSVLNGLSYLFYLSVMFLVNYKLGEYFETPGIINTIVGLLAFMTVPTGLLAANYLSQKELKGDEKEERLERREERLEKARIRAGKLSNTPITYQKVTGKFPPQDESYQKVSTDWRSVVGKLSNKQIVFIAQHEPREIVEECRKSRINISPRTASNWKRNAERVAQERGLL